MILQNLSLKIHVWTSYEPGQNVKLHQISIDIGLDIENAYLTIVTI